MDDPGQCASHHRRKPEQPELLKGPAPAKSAVAVLRAGFTDVFVTGMLIRWISVSPRPMVRPANPTGARLCVVPRMMVRNMNVITTSHTIAAVSE